MGYIKDYEILETIVRNDNFIVVSIKRISDNEIFTLGDIVTDSLTDPSTDYREEEIEWFYLNEKPNTPSNTEKTVVQSTSGTTMGLSTITKKNIINQHKDSVVNNIKNDFIQPIIFHSELRIGNYIQDYDKTKILLVERVDDTLKYRELNNTSLYSESNHITNLKPIEINEDWLVRFGFEIRSNNWKSLSICSDWFYLYLEKLAGFKMSINKESVYLPHIKYVHQLQNLYFSLTGLELSIANSIKH